MNQTISGDVAKNKAAGTDENPVEFVVAGKDAHDDLWPILGSKNLMRIG